MRSWYRRVVSEWRSRSSTTGAHCFRRKPFHWELLADPCKYSSRGAIRRSSGRSKECSENLACKNIDSIWQQGYFTKWRTEDFVETSKMLRIHVFWHALNCLSKPLLRTLIVARPDFFPQCNIPYRWNFEQRWVSSAILIEQVHTSSQYSRYKDTLRIWSKIMNWSQTSSFLPKLAPKCTIS